MAGERFPGDDRAVTGYQRLRIGNLVLALLHTAQVVALLALSTDFTIPLTETFQEGPPGSRPPTPDVLWDLPLGPAVAAFLALAALDHLLVAVRPLNRWYDGWLARGVNPARWVEYSFSASLMIVLIALLVGITEPVALVPIVGANAAMILLGWQMERSNPPDRERTDWVPFLFGCLVGIVPWVAIVIAVIGAETGAGDVPGFVYGILVSLFVLFFSFAVNQWLQYARIGKWRDYLVGEWTYLVLSLVAKSLLAWQVFANVLVL